MTKSDLHEQFCVEVKRRRRQLGLTQSDLAQRLGVQQATVAETEAGRKEPTLSKVQAYAIALETTVIDLLGGIHAETR